MVLKLCVKESINLPNTFFCDFFFKDSKQKFKFMPALVYKFTGT